MTDPQAALFVVSLLAAVLVGIAALLARPPRS